MVRSRSTLEQVLETAIAGAMRKLVPAIHQKVAALVAERLEEDLVAKRSSRRAPAPRGRRVRRRPEELTKWVADRRARRVPRFVIEMTGGLDTKKKIVARFGEGVVFEKGKPLPKAAKAA